MDIGKIVGGVLIAGTTAAICLWPEHDVQAKADESVRPVRSVVVKAGTRLPDLQMTGKVKANEERILAFKQPGRIQRIPISSGQTVKKGDKLAWLDPLDFEKDLAKAEAAEKRDRMTYERKLEAARKKAISQEELSQAEAQLKLSEAQLALSRRALEDTVLLAPFDGTVAAIPASELDMVTPATRVVLVHDLEKVKIDVVFPETLTILAKKLQAVGDTNCVCNLAKVSFDSVPGRSFPVRFVEYVTTADRTTQTFVATYVMDTPRDLMLLPGMSATLTVSGDAYRYEGDDLEKAICLPESAIGVASDGTHFVWVLEATQEKAVFVARRRTLSLARRQDFGVTVADGVKPGERVATAGVMELTEGRKVRLLAE